ncbi:MAG: TorF family putative porin [Candidatus Woesearchaeota archaeon]
MKSVNILLATAVAAFHFFIAPGPTWPAEPAKDLKQKNTVEAGTDRSLNSCLNVDLLSKYVSRGFQYSKGPVIQPSISATHSNSYGDFTVIGFLNIDSEQRLPNEANLTVDFSKTIGRTSVSLGYTYLTFPNTFSKDTQEVYARMGLDVLLNPSLCVVHDFGDGKGTYAEFSAGRVLKGLPVSLEVALGYNSHYYRERSGLSHAEFRIGFPMKITNNLVVTPKVCYSKFLDNDFEDHLYGCVLFEAGF